MDQKTSNQEALKDAAADDPRTSSGDHGDGLVDTTQQLIDEVNQLLGGDPKAAAPDSTKEIDTAAGRQTTYGDSVETLKSFLSGLTDEKPDVKEEHPEPEDHTAEMESDSESEEASESSFDVEAQKSVFAEPTSDEEAGEESESDDEDEVDPTEKYLAELRDAFDEETSDADDTASPGDDLEVPADPVAESVSVESWLATNVDEVPANALDEPEEVSAAAETEVPVIDQPPESETEEPALEDSVSEPAISQPAVAEKFCDQIEEDVAIELNSFADLEVFFSRKFRKLEDRIGGMFSSLASQIEQLQGLERPAPRQRPKTATSINPSDDSPENTIDSEDTSFEDDESNEAPRTDAAKIEALKEQLTSKLREAEIELSINRAKLSQQKAEIEQMQADLERREAAVEAKLEQAKKTSAAATNVEKKRGLMDRWKRHLGD